MVGPDCAVTRNDQRPGGGGAVAGRQGGRSLRQDVRMSMREFQASVDVPADLPAVFAHLDDPSLTTSYFDGLARWEPRSPVRIHEVGTIIDAAVNVGGTRRETAVVVTERTPDELITWGPAEGFPVGGGWVLREAAHGTHVVFRLEIEVPGGVAGRLLAKGIEPTVRSVVDRSLRRLAAQVRRPA